MNGIKEEEKLIEPVVLKKKKSKLVAYTLWLFGGFFGVHHIYLGRDLHALVYITTLGGYFGVGWLRDLFRIPTYVADANDDPSFIEKFKREVRENQKPQFSMIRFSAAIAVAYLWAELFCNAIPGDEVYGINFRHLILLLPVVAASGIWVVGNIGRQQGSIWSPLIGGYLAYPSSYYIDDHSMWLLAIIVASGLSFDSFGKQWRLKPRKQKNFITRLFYLSLALSIYFSMIGSYLYFNAIVTDSEGEDIKLSEAIQHFLTSPIWIDFKRSLEVTWNQAKNQGFWATWRQLVDLTDPRGEINAYNVLGLSQTASQSEVTSRWRALSRDNHPDKVKGSEEERRQAQERFMEIQQAYEILSNSKHRRQRRNRRSS